MSPSTLSPEMLHALGSEVRLIGGAALGMILAAWVAVHLLDALKAKWGKGSG